MAEHPLLGRRVAVRLVQRADPLVVPCLATDDTLPVSRIPIRIIREWDQAWARVLEVQRILNAYYERDNQL